jgi:hypothetical protein
VCVCVSHMYYCVLKKIVEMKSLLERRSCEIEQLKGDVNYKNLFIQNEMADVDTQKERNAVLTRQLEDANARSGGGETQTVYDKVAWRNNKSVCLFVVCIYVYTYVYTYCICCFVGGALRPREYTSTLESGSCSAA